jgi:hypothetical protein
MSFPLSSVECYWQSEYAGAAKDGGIGGAPSDGSSYAHTLNIKNLIFKCR